LLNARTKSIVKSNPECLKLLIANWNALSVYSQTSVKWVFFLFKHFFIVFNCNHSLPSSFLPSDILLLGLRPPNSRNILSFVRSTSTSKGRNLFAAAKLYFAPDCLNVIIIISLSAETHLQPGVNCTDCTMKLVF
jgi:hypothetical protein